MSQRWILRCFLRKGGPIATGSLFITLDLDVGGLIKGKSNRKGRKNGKVSI